MSYDEYGKPIQNKTIAIVLAIFLGIWSWLYTYKYDAWKFWINLFLIILTMGFFGIVTYIWVIVDQATKPDEFFENYWKD